MGSKQKMNWSMWLVSWWIILCGMWGVSANAFIVFGGNPPNPSDVAPPLTLTEASLFDRSVAFLYEGENPVQTGVVTGSFDPNRIAVIRGKVLNSSDQPMVGVKVNILHHPEWGETYTRSDGMFDLVVNGGGALTVEYSRWGLLPLQRTIDVPYQDYTWVDDVVLTSLDYNWSYIDLSAADDIQVAFSPPVQDAHGSRQSILMFPKGTQAAMVLPDGSTTYLSQFSVNATEYTVGDTGQQAMPADLPPPTAYTYAVEYSIDEAFYSNAQHVFFSQPIWSYTDNFINFPVGSIVPAGWYDRQKAAWVSSANGRIVKIVDIQDDLAILDVSGRGTATAQELADLGITDAERQQLAWIYPVGKTLWRVPISHFSAWDFNWETIFPNGAGKPDIEGKPDKDEDNPNPQCGSIIECQNQVLGESLPVAGTGWALNYRTSRVLGDKMAYTIRLPIKGDDDVVDYEALWVKIKIAGQRFELRFPRDTPEYYYDFVWDGKDAYGRTLQGQQKAYIRFAYEYKVTYKPVSGFGRFLPNPPPSSAYTPPPWEEQYGVPNKIPGRGYDALWSSWQVLPLGILWDARGLGLGGWMLDVQHAYSPITRTLILGTGEQRTSVNLLGAETSTVNPQILYGGLLATAPDGSIYFTENYRVKRRSPTGITETVAGNGYCSTPPVEGGNAQAACFNDIYSIRVDNAGLLYISGRCPNGQGGYGCLRRVATDGTITTIAGGGSHSIDELAAPNYTGNLVATEINFDRIDKAIAYKDSNIYLLAAKLANGSTSSIYQMDSYGFVRLIAQNVAGGTSGISSFEMMNDGSLLLSVTSSSAWGGYYASGWLVRILPNGTQVTYNFNDALTQLAQTNGGSRSCPNLLTVAPTGDVYASFSYCNNSGQNTRIFQLDFENQRLTLVAGGGTSRQDHVAATATNFIYLYDLVTAPDGVMYFIDYVSTGIRTLRRLGPVLPGVQMQDITIASEDGSEIYVFNRGGKHLRTVDAVTGKTLIEFTHDDKGYVTQITDIDGEVTTIERDESQVTALVAPHGQRTEFELDANGYLQRLSNPANESHQMSYTDEGLLTQFINPRGHTSVMTYDTVGRLVSDQNAAGGGWQLTRSEDKDTYTVALHSQLGRTTEYQTDTVSPTEQRQITKHPDGTQTLETELANGVSVQTLPDGTKITKSYTPDPRFGLISPVLSQLTVKLPSGLQGVIGATRTVVTTQNNLSHPDEVRTTMTVNGKTSSRVYTAANKKVVATSAAGRVVNQWLDENGRVLQTQVPGMEAVFYAYDSTGRLTQIREGGVTDPETSVSQLVYGNDGYVSSVIDPLQQTEHYVRDSVGRVTTQTLPNQQQIQYGYDANSNLVSVTPPSQPAHQFVYDVLDQPIQYVAPAVGAIPHETLSSYNLDNQITRVTRPDNRVIDFNYDNAGRLQSMALPEGLQSLSYHATTGQLTTITHTDGSQLNYSYDGFLPVSESWVGGTVAGTVSQRYNSDFRTVELKVNEQSVGYEYDADGLMTHVGALTLTRNPQNGLLLGSQLHQVTTERTYTRFGEIASEIAKMGNLVLYQANYTRDKLGRIATKTETISGNVVTEEYGYDATGRLIEAKRNGNPTLYQYDANGNRTQTGNVTASYDAQDRLINNGAITYTHNTDGDLQTKFQGGQTTQYHYDTLGNLIRVQLPSDNVEYVLDGNDRRVARKLNNVITHRWLYQGSFTPIAEINAQGEIVARYVYGSRDHVPEYIFTATAVYRLVVDQLGSVRLVVNAQTGEIVQQLSYDAWGNVLQDTSPGLQPFGFAGGMYDPQTSLVHFGAREYDPSIGRFLSKDPLGFASEDTNFYTYVYNDPVNKIDPSGLFMNFVASCLLSGGIEVVYQVAVEQRHFGCIDWTSVLWETVTGCVKLPKWRKPMRGSGGGCGFNSFPADTLVHTEQGLKPIQDIQVGDKVLALDERTGQTSYQPVLQLIQNKGQYQFIKVTLENGEQLEATAEHPFYIQGKGWNAAANLKVGDALLLHNGTTLVVKTLDTSVRVDAVYNFTVANLHNYFVGKDGVAVHNSGGCPSLKGDPYHPDSVRDRIKPPYRPNPAHNKKSPDYNPRKTPEPPDAADVYQNATQEELGTWFGKNASGQTYRYSYDNAGGAHFSGTFE